MEFALSACRSILGSDTPARIVRKEQLMKDPVRRFAIIKLGLVIGFIVLVVVVLLGKIG
ncbi:hypothetical protein ES703_111051 [subsurface metagenome]